MVATDDRMDALECISCGARWQGSTVRIVMALHGKCLVCGGGVRIVHGSGESGSAEDEGEWLLRTAAARISEAELPDEPSPPGGSASAVIAEARHARRVARRRRAELVTRREELRRLRDALAETVERARLRVEPSFDQRAAVNASLDILGEVDRVFAEPAGAPTGPS